MSSPPSVAAVKPIAHLAAGGHGSSSQPRIEEDTSSSTFEQQKILSIGHEYTSSCLNPNLPYFTTISSPKINDDGAFSRVYSDNNGGGDSMDVDTLSQTPQISFPRPISPDNVMDINKEEWDLKKIASELILEITPVFHGALSKAGVPDDFYQSCMADLLQMMARLTTDNSSSMMDTDQKLVVPDDGTDGMQMGEMGGFESDMTDQYVDNAPGGFTSQSEEAVTEEDSVAVLAASTHISSGSDWKDVLDMSTQSKRKESMLTAENGKDKRMYCNLYINTRPPHSVFFIYTTLCQCQTIHLLRMRRRRSQ